MQSNLKPVKVSVIMLAYNHAPYIAQAIDSVLMQDIDCNLEILIGDDASTDGTQEIISDYARRFPDKIVPVLRPCNIGATKNYYDLMEQAQGEYLAYLECDDFWTDSGKLRKQVEILEYNPEYIGCTHFVTPVDENGLPVADTIGWVSRKSRYTLTDFDGITLPGHGNSMVHRNIIRNSGGAYRDLITLHPLIGDRSLCILLLSKGPVYQIQRELGCYRIPTAASESATAALFINNPRKILDDYDFTKKLEIYSREQLGVEANFEPYKEELLFDAVWTFLRHPGKNSGSTAGQMLRSMHSMKHIRFLLAQIARKFVNKLR